jgi:hypothetical protein
MSSSSRGRFAAYLFLEELRACAPAGTHLVREMQFLQKLAHEVEELE